MTRLRAVLASALVVTAAIALLRLTSGAAPTPALPPGHVRLVIPTSQGDRECVVYVPRGCDGVGPVPVVIMLHGMGGTAAHALRETGWSAKADKETFIAVYPEATRPDMDRPPSFARNPQAWNDGSGRFHAAEKGIDDVAFLKAVIDRIRADHTIDDSRIFVAGFSNGACMAFRAGAELADRIAAIAPGAGTCWTESPRPARPISVCAITGTADTLNPLDGGFPRLAFGGKEQGGRPKPAVQAVIDRWVQALECPAQPRRDETSDGVHTRVYGPGKDGAEVMLITVDGLGHHWAGGTSQAPEFLVGAPTDTLVATDVVWEFFRAHPAP
jgi:polyhydroxybutyrate depolymerase